MSLFFVESVESCFSKGKRRALALFAFLTVLSMWCDHDSRLSNVTPRYLVVFFHLMGVLYMCSWVIGALLKRDHFFLVKNMAALFSVLMLIFQVENQSSRVRRCVLR